MASIALLYSTGYSVAAFGRGPWMGRMARVNVMVALALIMIVILTLSPALAPQRLAANSQFKLILSRPLPAAKDRTPRGDPFTYLRFESGTYGLERLKQLAAVTNRPEAETIRDLAKASLARENRWQSVVSADLTRKNLAGLTIYPAGRSLEPTLIDALVAERSNANSEMLHPECSPDNCSGIFVDLNADGVEEFVLLRFGYGSAFEKRAGKWVSFGRVQPPTGVEMGAHIRGALANGEFSAVAPRWKNLSIGGREYVLTEVK